MSGFISTISWRWTFWLGLIIAGSTCPLVFFYPETYGPVLLQRRAKKLRKETGNLSIVAPLDLQPHDLRATLTVTLTRPLRMIAKEFMVALTCLYLSLAYAIFYLYFQAYPLIFEDIYGMSTGVAGLIYLPSKQALCPNVPYKDWKKTKVTNKLPQLQSAAFSPVEFSSGTTVFSRAQKPAEPPGPKTKTTAAFP